MSLEVGGQKLGEQQQAGWRPSRSRRAVRRAPGAPGAHLLPVAPEGRAEVARVFRALSEPARIALLVFLDESERSGTECVGHLGLSQSRVSAHLARLVAAGLVAVRRSGPGVSYRIADGRALDLIHLGADVVARAGTFGR